MSPSERTDERGSPSSMDESVPFLCRPRPIRAYLSAWFFVPLTWRSSRRGKGGSGRKGPGLCRESRGHYGVRVGPP